MSTTQSVALPSTPTAGVATIASFGTTISPRASSIEARLELSLDELIKERKKEVKKKKEKKHESVKKETTTQSKKQQPTQQTKQAAAQAEKRGALVNKNRRLPALPESSKSNAISSTKNAKKSEKSVAGKRAAATNKHNHVVVAPAQMTQKKKKKAATPPVTAQTLPLPQKKKASSVQVPKQPQQPAQKLSTKQKKHVAPQQIVRIIRQQPQQQQKSKVNKAKVQNITPAATTSSKPRKVVRSNDKASKIRITIQQPHSTSAASKRSQKQAKAPQKAAIMNVVLPAKVAHNFSSEAAVRAQKVVRRVQSRKQATSKNGAFVVRKLFSVRKI